MRIGIIGAGRIGQALARRWIPAGHDIMLSNSRGPDTIRDIADALRCRAGFAEEAASFGDVTIVAVPFANIEMLPPIIVGRRVVIDTCNYYPDRDGVSPSIEDGSETTSGRLQAILPEAAVVKAFNSIRADLLAAGGASLSNGKIHALPIASDHNDAADLVAGLVKDAGLDPVNVGPLAESWRFERARPAYCRPLDAVELRARLMQTDRSDYVAEGSWRQD